LILAAISTRGRDAAAADSAPLASSIRSTVAKFTPENVAAHLHAKLYEQSPQRLWQTFLGKRHLLVTSWIHTRLYDVDFGSGRPRYVEAVMPKLDGLVQLMEAAPMEAPNPTEKRHWAADGVDVQLHLAKETMLRLLSDPLLRKHSA
jgi:Transferase family